MQLRRLRLSGIGPFAQQLEVDFDVLGESGLFLLEGPTGAGKSILIDAVVFALYGKTASDQVSEERLRSHHAEATAASWVDVVFEVDQGIYRVHRTPAYVRPKARGTGTTRQNASARLVRITTPDDFDSGEVVSTSAQEVGSEITALIGLNRAQFAQTVVLPQGEFAAFLRARAEERRDVLESIFRTGLYEDVTTELVEARKAAQQQRSQMVEKISRAAALFVSVTTFDGESPEGFDQTDDPDALAARADEVLNQCHNDVTELHELRNACQQHYDDARLRQQREHNLAEAMDRRIHLLDRKSVLADHQEHIDAQSDTVRWARKAATVQGALQAQDRARQNLDQANSAVDNARCLSGYDAAEHTEEYVQQAMTELIGQRNQLEQLQLLLSTLVDRDEQQRKLAAAIDATEERRQSLASAVNAAPARMQQLDAAISAAQQAQIALPSAEQASARAEKTVEMFRRHDELTSLRAEHQQALDAATARSEAAINHTARLRHLRNRGMAGELATHLGAGAACPVCGATEHPAPAQLSDEHPTQADIDTAEQQQATAAAGVDQSRRRVDHVDAELATLQPTIGELEATEAHADAEAAAAHVAQLRERAQHAETALAERHQLDVQAQHDADAMVETREELARLRHEHETAAIDLARDRSRIDAAVAPEALSTGDHHCIGQREARLTEAINATDIQRGRVETLLDAIRNVDSATAQAHQCDRDVHNALGDSHFATIAQARQASLPETEIDRLETLITEHQNNKAAIAEGLAEPAIAALTGTEQPDIESAAQNVSQTAQRLQNVQERLSAAEHIVSRADSAYRELVDAIAAGSQVVKDTAAVVRTANIAAASDSVNAKKITLGSYVLLRRFEDVINAANARLTPMSAGRYQLIRTDELESRGARRAGLGLRVMDHVTGTEREPRTLSGGQTFYTSLSLALGLADVVMGETGGIRLGTLFIDEGFGTLDAETLDTVMAELGRLSSGGRLVGVVSHVSELKQRISDQVSVRTNKDGSSRIAVNSSR